MKFLSFWRLQFVLILFVTRVDASTPYKSVVVKDGGTISGVVRLSGSAPKLVQFNVPKDNDWCGRKKSLPRLVVGKDGGVKNTVVFLDGIAEGEGLKRATKVTFEQKGCDYIPHVLVIPFGSSLEIVNSDAVLHNVHAFDAHAKTVFNIAQPIKGARFPVKPSVFKAGEIYEATCDAGHPWMSAFVVVAEHPYYTVTDADGKFELKNVPPGTYKIKMWHEGVNTTRVDMENGKPKLYTFEKPYEQTREVTIVANQHVRMDFAFTIQDGNNRETR